MGSSADSTATALVAVMVAIIVIIFVITLIGYIFSSIGLYTMAKKRSQANKAFWAWIPIGQYYLMGLLAKETGERNGTGKYASMPTLLPVGSAVVAVCDVVLTVVHIPILVVLLSLALEIVYLTCLYGVIKGYDTKDKAGMHVALSFFILLYSSILLFVFRNRPFLYGEPSGNNQITPTL